MTDVDSQMALAFDNVSFGYTQSDSLVLSKVSLGYAPGELALVCGPTGSGKSTLLRVANGLVPHFSGGRLSGRVAILGQILAGVRPNSVAADVAYVNQNPGAGFVALNVVDEICFGMEQLGFGRDEMERRLAEVAHALDLTELLESPLLELSGGQQQRVAIASALAAGARILLLDEPTSALDAAAASKTIELLARLSRQHGITILMAEHRIDRLLDVVDSITVVHGDGQVSKASASSGIKEMLRDARLVPPFVELGRRLGWTPLPLTIAEAASAWAANSPTWQSLAAAASGGVAVSANGLCVGYGSKRHPEPDVITDLNLELRAGSATAIVGPNGAGKSTILWALQGSLKPTAGRLEPAGQIALVPQQASDLLYLPTVSAEFEASDKTAPAGRGATASLFASLAGRVDPQLHPRDLSIGQQLALALAIQMAQGAKTLLLDEPTRGLDYLAKSNLAETLRTLSRQGHCVVVATHDLDFAAEFADRVITVNRGRLVSDSPTASALGSLGNNPSTLALVARESGLVALRQVVTQ